jgi:hypothetical protein
MDSITRSRAGLLTLKAEYPFCHANFDLLGHFPWIHFDEFDFSVRMQSATDCVAGRSSGE